MIMMKSNELRDEGGLKITEARRGLRCGPEEDQSRATTSSCRRERGYTSLDAVRARLGP